METQANTYAFTLTVPLTFYDYFTINVNVNNLPRMIIKLNASWSYFPMHVTSQYFHKH